MMQIPILMISLFFAITIAIEKYKFISVKTCYHMLLISTAAYGIFTIYFSRITSSETLITSYLMTLFINFVFITRSFIYSDLKTYKLPLIYCLLLTTANILPHLKSLFEIAMAIEIFTFILFLLHSYGFNLSKNLESQAKHFISNFIGSSCLFGGMFIIYSSLGTIQLESLSTISKNSMEFFGLLLFVFGALGKLGVSPLHNWLLNSTESLPSMFTLLIVNHILFTLFCIIPRLQHLENLHHIFSIVGWFSFFIGSFFTLSQHHTRRWVTFINISLFGLLILGFIHFKAKMQVNFLFFISIVLSNLTLFGIFSMFENKKVSYLIQEDLRGLFDRSRFYAIAIMIAIASYTFLPLTAGFVAKFLLIGSNIENPLISPVKIDIIFAYTILSLITFSTLQVTNIMFQKSKTHQSLEIQFINSNLMKIFFLFLMILILSFGTILSKYYINLL